MQNSNTRTILPTYKCIGHFLLLKYSKKSPSVKFNFKQMYPSQKNSQFLYYKSFYLECQGKCLLYSKV